MIVVVMGVSGSGKTTVAAALAGRLDWAFLDADDLHPAGNLERMRAGVPLTDEDRVPWLRSVADWMNSERAQRRHAVVACSALRRCHRDVLRGGDVHFVLLDGPRAVIEARLRDRLDHFMPPSLLDSQLATLERPDADEQAIVMAVGRPSALVARDLARRFGV